MDLPCWCTNMGHQYAVTTNQQTHPVFTFVPLKMCKLLEDSFSITRHRCRGDHCGVTHCENLEIQNAVFSKDATGLKTSTKIYLSPPQRLPLGIPIKISIIEKIESARSLFLSPQPPHNTKRPLRRREKIYCFRIR